MRHRSLTRSALVAWFSLSAGGCGLLLVSGPPAGHESLEYFSCTESRALPMLDVIWGGLSLAGLGIVVSDEDESDEDESGENELDDDDTKAVIGIAVASVALSSWAAYRGKKKVDACRDAKLHLAQRSGEAAELARVKIQSDSTRSEESPRTTPAFIGARR